MTRRIFIAAAFYATLLGLWQGLSSSGLVPPDRFPSPLQVGQSLSAGFQDGTLLRGLGRARPR